MGSAAKRHTVIEMMPIDDLVINALEDLITKYDGVVNACKALHSRWPNKTEKTWEKTVSRIRKKKYENISIDSYEQILHAANIQMPSFEYKQTIWRVTGFTPWKSKQKTNPFEIKHWYYTTRGHAETRMKDMKEKGLLIDWAECEGVWKELPTS